MPGENSVVVTPTASGKTLCYNLPVIHDLLSDPAARSIYLFLRKPSPKTNSPNLTISKPPSSPDSCTPLRTPHSASPLAPATYDGDTPQRDRLVCVKTRDWC